MISIIKFNFIVSVIPAPSGEYLTYSTRWFPPNSNGITFLLECLQFCLCLCDTSRINRAVMNALMNASTPSSYYVTGEVIKNYLDDEYLRTLINDVEQISNIQSVILMESASLVDGVRNEIDSFSGMHRIYLTGGGAEIIYPYINKYFPRHKVSKVEEPQLALVKAMARA